MMLYPAFQLLLLLFSQKYYGHKYPFQTCSFSSQTSFVSNNKTFFQQLSWNRLCQNATYVESKQTLKTVSSVIIVENLHAIHVATVTFVIYVWGTSFFCLIFKISVGNSNLPKDPDIFRLLRLFGRCLGTFC